MSNVSIIIPTTDFAFQNISLEAPISLPGGFYFSKITFNNNPLIIQTTKSTTKQGIVKTGKKHYCDLMFLHQSSEINLQWFELLEEKCQSLLLEKSSEWFQTPLTLNDIENAFIPIIKVYKSGKYCLIRTNIRTNSNNGEPLIKIYDENYTLLTPETITNETNIMSIIGIQGIRFSSKNFQIDMELKQIMILEEEERIFENCLIRKKGCEQLTNHEMNTKIDFISQSEKNDNIEEEKLFDNTNHLFDLSIHTTKKENIEEKVDNIKENIEEKLDNINENMKEKVDNINENAEENVKENVKENMEEMDLEEIIDLETMMNDKETVTLKNRKKVYEDLYKEAKQKAKEAKKQVILAYLKAKNIRQTYMLDNLEESDFDEEIEEVNESQLEEFE